MRSGKKGHYDKPVISRIMLDQEQAVLQVCRVGGAYFGWGGILSAGFCVGDQAGGTMSACNTAVRGNAFIDNAASPFTASAQPS